MNSTWNPMTDIRSRIAMPFCGRTSAGYLAAQGHVSPFGATREAGFKATGPDAWSPPTL